jgi:hypothetical protein
MARFSGICDSPGRQTFQTMNSITSLLSPLMGLFTVRETADAVTQDQNDPAESADVLGTMCGVHGCPRMLDEAPVLPLGRRTEDLTLAKRELFPNSWNAVASLGPGPRAGLFGRGRRTRTIAVRYCEECRAAAELWMQEHAGE